MSRTQLAAVAAWVAVPIIAAIGHGVLSGADWHAAADSVLSVVAFAGAGFGLTALLILAIGWVNGGFQP